MSQPTKVAEIREAFLAFFEGKEHLRLASDSLIPSNDPTLLFTGAGMNQFKDEFLGKGRDFRRATTAQKCLRVPDLGNVGVTPRHHTFFEMLGNFSFGDYFKKETIPWEWEFFTEVLGWDADRFVVTVYEDDDEAFQIWHELVGLPTDRIYRFGEKENFWPSSAPSKGPNGVCGPCSEIYWDQEPGQALPANAGLEDLPGRFLEVGNFVFTQFDRQDGGKLAPLPQKNIDVGLGLERIAAVAQNVPNNFETDLFAPILHGIEEACGQKYQSTDMVGVRMRRIADHCRAVFFCIADGAMPGREGRGYVVRKILRRAVRDGLDLSMQKPFLAELLPCVQEAMAEAYPELIAQADTIRALVEGEEVRFREVYAHGIDRLQADMEELRAQNKTVFPGALAFELHDTYGFPLDTSRVILEEQGFSLDQAGFDAAMEAQKARARSGSEISADVFAESLPSQLQSAGIPTTQFLGYHEHQVKTQVAALLRQQDFVDQLDAGEEGLLLVPQTVFYAEGGGQVGDAGVFQVNGEDVFQITQTTQENGFYFHHGRCLQKLQVGQEGVLRLQQSSRRAAERHHTATHLLHAAMKQLVGAHVNQAGSRVSPESLRFDYTHPDALGPELLRTIEDLVNSQIQAAIPVETCIRSLAEAKAEGVTALFGEKYGEEVRVVTVPGFSKELCGGCHVPNTGAIGPFRILSDRALAAGVRRLEAVAGDAAWSVIHQEQDLLRSLSQELKAPAAQLPKRIAALKEELKKAKERKAPQGPSAEALMAELQACEGALAWKHLPGLDANDLRSLSDGMRGELPAVVLLTGGDDQSVPFLFLCHRGGPHKAGQLARELGQKLGGGGGGRPDFAQGKGSQGKHLAEAVEELQKSLAANA